jgi:hypothetical protein
MFRRLLLVLIALLLVLPTPLLAQATNPQPRTNGELLFAPKFSASSDLEAAFDSEWMNLAAANSVATISSQAPGVVLTALVPGRTFGNFIAEVEILPGAQPAGVHTGFVFRADAHPDIDVNAYDLFVDQTADVVGLSTLVEGGREEDKESLGSARLSELGYDPDAANTLRLEAVGSQLRVFVNDNFAFEVDSTFVLSGGLGLQLGSPDDLAAGASATAQYSNLRIYAPGTEQTSAPVAPAQSAPAAAAAPVAPRANGAVLFATAFNDPGDLEGIFSEDEMLLDIHDGVATLTAWISNSLEGALLPGRIFDDFVLEVDINPQTVLSGADFGVFFRSSDALYMADDLYYFGIAPDSNDLYGIYYRADASYDVEELGSASLDDLAYKPNAMNRLRLEIVGDTIVVFLNGIYALTADGSFTPQGALGLAIGTGTEAGPNNPVRADFDNLTIYAPGAAPAAESDDTNAPALEAEAAGIFAMVSAPTLNVRSGPGTTFPVVGKLTQDEVVFVDARNADCTWLQVTSLDIEGWVSRQLVDLMLAECDEVPLAGAAGGAGASDGAAAAPAGSSSAIVTDFENFGTWKRGDEAWGTFTQSSAKAAGGTYAGKLAYDFPANAPDGKNYVVFKQELPIAGNPVALTMDVYGDGSGSLLNVWVTDTGGQAWQFAFGPVSHTGWKSMTAPLDTTAKWPVGIVAGSKSDKTLDFPIKLRALVLDYPTDDAHAGVIYVDNLSTAAK